LVILILDIQVPLLLVLVPPRGLGLTSAFCCLVFYDDINCISSFFGYIQPSVQLILTSSSSRYTKFLWLKSDLDSESLCQCQALNLGVDRIVLVVLQP
jgi:hypothetical protein